MDYRSDMPYGLIYLDSSSNREALPLLSITAKASIKDVTASVSLAQEYLNDTQETLDAVYVFPVPVRAAVCRFEMVRENGKRIVGIVQETEEARETYREAVEMGHTASLMEQETPDVFQVSVGNIAGGEKVTIELSYVTELLDDEEADSLRFHLPVAGVGGRYGTGGPAISPLGATFLKLSIDVEMVAPINKIHCPSHSVETTLGLNPSISPNLLSSHYATVSFATPQPLEKDFVLIIKSAGLDSPRCVAEVGMDSVGMSITVVPRFKLPDVSKQEFVFLVDRSGSMAEDRIETARKAMVVLLRSLPGKDTTFNIFSFGSTYDSLWPSSNPYNQRSLDTATKMVDKMEANYGGTEIRAAVEGVFKVKDANRPTSLFVLTDGEAWDLEATLDSIKLAVKSASPQNSLRVFGLGIGTSASTAMCEGIARAGNGIAMFVGDNNENFTGKANRLLKAAKSRAISGIRVDWGIKEEVESKEEEFEIVEKDVESGTKGEPKVLSLFDSTINPDDSATLSDVPPATPVVLAPFPTLQQTPSAIRNIFPSSRLHIYAIIKSSALINGPPGVVIITGTTPAGDEVRLEIPVTISQSTTIGAVGTRVDLTPQLSIHTIAAKKIIQDYEDGNHNLEIEDQELLARTVKSVIVRLGKTYSIAPSGTSFVAVDESEVVDAKSKKRVRSTAPPPVQQFSRSMAFGGGGPAGMIRPTVRVAAAPAPRGMGGMRMRSMMASPWGDADPSTGLFSTAVPPPPPSRPESIRLGVLRVGSSNKKEKATPPVEQSDSDRLDAIARTQSFEGSFSPSVVPLLRLANPTSTFVNLLSTELRGKLSATERKEVVATILVILYLRENMGGERDAWEGMVEKAREFVVAVFEKHGERFDVGLEEKMALLM